MKKKFGCKVEYSGHEVAEAASMLGISSLKTCYIDRSMYGSDQSASLEFRGMQELISIKRMHVAYGQPKLGKILEEKPQQKIKKTYNNYNYFKFKNLF